MYNIKLINHAIKSKCKFLEIGLIFFLLFIASISIAHGEVGEKQMEKTSQPQVLEPIIYGQIKEEQNQKDLGTFGLSLEELMNIKVSVATKTRMSVEKAPSIVSVITAKEIRNMGARNLEDILRTMAGFDITNDSLQMHLGVRGMLENSTTNNKVNIMMDGHSLRTDYFGDLQFLINYIPINSIKRIEIIRGPGSALYGANAFWGVINLITKKGRDTSSRISMRSGSFNSVQPSGELSYKDDKIETYLYGEYYKSDGPSLMVESDSATVIFEDTVASSTPNKTIEKESWYNLKAELNYLDFSLSGLIMKTSEIMPKIGITFSLVDEDDVSIDLYYGALKYNNRFGNVNVDAKIYHDYYDYHSKFECYSEETAVFVSEVWYPDAEPYPAGVGIHGSAILKTQRTGSEIVFNTDFLDETINLTGGFLYEKSSLWGIDTLANGNLVGERYSLNGNNYYPFQYLGGNYTIADGIPSWADDAVRHISAVYFQSVFNIEEAFSIKRDMKNLNLTLGVRYDNYDDVGDSINPRIGLVCAPTAKLYFKVLFGQAFRAPSFIELHVRNNPVQYGNPNLEAEKIKTYEGLIGFNFTEKIKSSLTAFYIKCDNLIEKTEVQGLDKPKFNNVGTVEGYGVEGELKMIYDIYKYVYLNFTAQDRKNTTNTIITSTLGQTFTQKDYDPGGSASFMGNIVLNYDIFAWLIANTSVNYVGQRNNSEEMIWRGENLEKKNLFDTTGARTLLNVSFTLINLLKNVEMQVSVFNILDQDHHDPDLSLQIENGIPRAGRSFTAKVSYDF